MNIYGWKQVKKEITLESILGETYVQFAPESVDFDVDIESLLRDTKKFSYTDISIKYIDYNISKRDYKGELFIEKGKNLIALCMLYMELHHHGTDYSFVENVLMGKDGYVYAKELPVDLNEKYKKWADKLERKIQLLVDSGTIDNIREICNDFANMKFTAEVCEVVYIGPTIEINYSEDMTISQFAEVVKENCHIIPVFTKPGSLDLYPESTTLKSLGIIGQKSFLIPTKLHISSFINDFREQNGLKSIIFFRYEKRPWAYILPETHFDDVQKVPNVFVCLYNKLFLKFLLALGAYK